MLNRIKEILTPPTERHVNTSDEKVRSVLNENGNSELDEFLAERLSHIMKVKKLKPQEVANILQLKFISENDKKSFNTLDSLVKHYQGKQEKILIALIEVNQTQGKTNKKIIGTLPLKANYLNSLGERIISYKKLQKHSKDGEQKVKDMKVSNNTKENKTIIFSTKGLPEEGKQRIAKLIEKFYNQGYHNLIVKYTCDLNKKPVRVFNHYEYALTECNPKKVTALIMEYNADTSLAKYLDLNKVNIFAQADVTFQAKKSQDTALPKISEEVTAVDSQINNTDEFYTKLNEIVELYKSDSEKANTLEWDVLLNKYINIIKVEERKGEK